MSHEEDLGDELEIVDNHGVNHSPSEEPAQQPPSSNVEDEQRLDCDCGKQECKNLPASSLYIESVTTGKFTKEWHTRKGNPDCYIAVQNKITEEHSLASKSAIS